MNPLKRLLDKARPAFGEGGRLSALHSVFEGVESFLFTPSTTGGLRGSHIHDSVDSKRVMITVVIALLPCLLFGMYNAGYQNRLGSGATTFPFWPLMLYGFLAILPALLTSYITGLAVEFISAQLKREEIQEGFLVTGILIPLICPVNTPCWMIAVATAFSVIFAKEVFGGTGYNIFNVALVTRAFLFFAYPAQMSGDTAFVPTRTILGVGSDIGLADGFTGATPLAQLAGSSGGHFTFTNILGDPLSLSDAFFGLIPGSFGETSTLCILIGAAILLIAGVVDWRIIFSVAAGGVVTAAIAHAFCDAAYPVSFLTPWEQLCYGGFAFAAVFMATDPVTAARTAAGKYVYGFLIGAVAIIIRIYNGGYPEGAMLAVLLGNALAPLIDWCVVRTNIRMRSRRAALSHKAR